MDLATNDTALSSSGTQAAPQILAISEFKPVANIDEQLDKAIQYNAERAQNERAARAPSAVKPAEGTFTSGSGVRWGTLHAGIDIANVVGTPILAAMGTAGWAQAEAARLLEDALQTSRLVLAIEEALAATTARLEEAERERETARASVGGLEHRLAALPPGVPPTAPVRRVRWMLEEYRVSLWAQQLGTAQAISDSRIRKALEA